MKALCSILAITFTALFVAQHAAAEILEFSDASTYDKDLSQVTHLPPALAKVFANHALNHELLGRDGHPLVGALDLMNRIFISDLYKGTSSPAVMVMTGLHLSKDIRYNAIYQHPKGFVVHLKMHDGDVALFFQGISSSDVSDIMSEIKRERRSALWNEVSPLPRAEADEDPALCGGPVHALASTPESNATVLSKVWGCSKGAVGGVKDATYGTVQAVGHVIAHPVASLSAAADALGRIPEIMSDVRGTFGELTSAFDALPSDVKWKLGCELVGSIGTAGLIWYFTGGAGSPLLMKTIAQSLAMINKAMPAGEAAVKTAALAAQMAKKADKVIEVQNFIAQGKDGAEFVKKVNTLDKAIDNLRTASSKLTFVDSRYGAFKATGRELSAAEGDYQTALATRNTLEAEDPALMGAVYAARGAIFQNYVDNPATRSVILKEIAKNGQLSFKQKAAAAAYVGATSCHVLTETAQTLNAPPLIAPAGNDGSSK